MRKLIALALMGLALLAASPIARANGDPVAEFSALTLARTPVAVQVPEVRLVSEQVEITPTGWYTTVRVTYHLQNVSSKSFTNLPYGFPVDWYGSGAARWDMRDGISESEHEVGWRDDYVRRISFMLNGKPLQYTCSGDTVLRTGRQLLTPEEEARDTNWELWEQRWFELFASDTSTNELSLWQYENDLCRRWYYARLDIAAGSTVVLEVTYELANAVAVGLYERNNPFDRLRYAVSSFAYDFSPAAYWGNGKAQSFSVLVDASHVTLEATDKMGLPLRKVGEDRYSYAAWDFDLAAAEPLQLLFRQRYREDNLAYILEHRIPSDRYTVEVSAADRRYPAGNLSDMDLSTATVLRAGAGDSLYITIRFKQPTSLRHILFYNGYGKSAEAWANNSRVDSMIVWQQYYEEEGKLKREAVFQGFAPFDWQRHVWPVVPQAVDGRLPEAFTWQGLTEVADIIHLGQWEWTTGQSYRTTELHFSIAAVKKGQKYDDLCISEIILLGE